MPPRCVALLGQGLDGALSIALLQRHELEVVAVHLTSTLMAPTDHVRRLAEQCGVPLEIVPFEEDYYQRLHHPRFGYARERAPCLDCRVAMLLVAGRLAARLDADFVVTGDVLGQRVPGQRKRDLALIDFHAGLAGKVLRPLSARLLPDTIAQERGLIPGGVLMSIQGRGRKSQHRLARQLGWPIPPVAAAGCALAEPSFAARLSRLDRDFPDASGNLIALLRFGRYWRIAEQASAVIAKSADESAALALWYESCGSETAWLLEPANFAGPTAVLVGEFGASHLRDLAQRLVHIARQKSLLVEVPIVRWRSGIASGVLECLPASASGTSNDG